MNDFERIMDALEKLDLDEVLLNKLRYQVKRCIGAVENEKKRQAQKKTAQQNMLVRCELYERVKKQHDEGVCYEDLARENGVSVITIMNWIGRSRSYRWHYNRRYLWSCEDNYKAFGNGCAECPFKDECKQMEKEVFG